MIRAGQDAAAQRSARMAGTTLQALLRDLNDDDHLRRDAAWYIEMAGVGPAGEHGGAEMLASWYRRNIRIFSNLAGISEPGDRIFVVYGAGHVPILRELVALSPRHSLADTLGFL